MPNPAGLVGWLHFDICASAARRDVTGRVCEEYPVGDLAEFSVEATDGFAKWMFPVPVPSIHRDDLKNFFGSTGFLWMDSAQN